jgi:sortase A
VKGQNRPLRDGLPITDDLDWGCNHSTQEVPSSRTTQGATDVAKVKEVVMPINKRPASVLSVRELEMTLALRRRTLRGSRGEGIPTIDRRVGGKSRTASRLLAVIEISLVIGLLATYATIFHHTNDLNTTALDSQLPASTATPVIQAVVLPSGHMPPSVPGGARFNQAEIPEALRPIQQAYVALPVPTEGPEQARSIYISRLWERPVPVVQGDGWEQLKKGIAQHLATANPGQAGNMVLSGHNDIYGEWFRYLDRLQPGDPIVVTTASREFTYRVTGTVIVDPSEVEVMSPTPQATVTLISCYPYLVDNLRIVVFGSLES